MDTITIEEYIENRDMYADPELDRKAIEFLKEKDGGVLRDLLKALYFDRSENSIEGLIERLEEEAFKSLLEKGYWSHESNHGIAAITWEKIKSKERTYIEISANLLMKDDVSNLLGFLNFLDSAPYYKGNFPESKRKEIVKQVKEDFKKACSFFKISWDVVGSWKEYVKGITASGEWTGGALGTITDYGIGEDGFVGNHIIEDSGGDFTFIEEGIPRNARSYVILVPEDPDDPNNDTYVALDGNVFTSLEEATEYFSNAVRTGEITYEDLVNDYLRQGDTEEEAKRAALNDIKEYGAVRKIVTHVPPRHIDDTLAVALLTQKYPEAEVEFVHPQDDREKMEKYVQDPTVALVDVGGDYNPDLKNYDHHQSSDVPFALKLVLKHEFPEYLKVLESDPVLSKELDYFDVRDRFGFKKASEEFPDVRTSLLQETMLLSLAQQGTESVKSLGKAFKTMLDRKIEAQKVMDNPEVEEVEGLKVAFDPVGVRSGEFFSRHKDVDILIQRNSMNPKHTSIIRNSYSKNAERIKLSLLKGKENVTFVHPAGFLAVISEEYESLKERAESIVKKAIEKDKSPGIELG